ncbi:ARID/BRIGHT DNA binding domain-containing protein, partial [Reticulomyxa filosa]
YLAPPERYKVFQFRTSLLDRLLVIPELSSLYFICLAGLVIFVMSTLIDDWLNNGYVFTSLTLVEWNFSELQSALHCWLYMFVYQYVLLFVFYCWRHDLFLFKAVQRLEKMLHTTRDKDRARLHQNANDSGKDLHKDKDITNNTNNKNSNKNNSNNNNNNNNVNKKISKVSKTHWINSLSLKHVLLWCCYASTQQPHKMDPMSKLLEQPDQQRNHQQQEQEKEKTNLKIEIKIKQFTF